MKAKMQIVSWLFILLLLVGCANVEETSTSNEKKEPKESVSANVGEEQEVTVTKDVEEEEPEPEPEKKQEPEQEPEPKLEEASNSFSGYERIEVDGGNLSGHREAKVVVDIGFGDREYWAFTNEHGQLIKVVAEKIVLQDDRNEPVTSSGRYYSDEAKVPGVESDQLDEGHVIADSLGGVSNAYNITPQDSSLNRHGDQAYMERVIRDAGSATDFEAIISYPNAETQIPSSYQYTYTVAGNKVVDKFDNVNPDEVNESLGLTDDKATEPTTSTKEGDISSVDTNGNGQVTIQEAKDAGYSMPITSEHWLYPHMRDNDHDGMVGE